MLNVKTATNEDENQLNYSPHVGHQRRQAGRLAQAQLGEGEETLTEETERKWKNTGN